MADDDRTPRRGNVTSLKLEHAEASPKFRAGEYIRQQRAADQAEKGLHHHAITQSVEYPHVQMSRRIESFEQKTRTGEYTLQTHLIPLGKRATETHSVDNRDILRIVNMPSEDAIRTYAGYEKTVTTREINRHLAQQILPQPVQQQQPDNTRPSQGKVAVASPDGGMVAQQREAGRVAGLLQDPAKMRAAMKQESGHHQKQNTDANTQGRGARGAGQPRKPPADA
jgi:hypothetical protein